MKETPENKEDQTPKTDNNSGGDTSTTTTAEPSSPTGAQTQAAAAPIAGDANRSGATWPGKAALVLSLAALGLSGYLYWQNQQQLAQEQDLLSQQRVLHAQTEAAMAQAKAEVSQSLSDASVMIGQLQARSEQSQREVAELQERLTRSIQQVSAQQQISSRDWLLAEAEYLLRLANQRVLMEQTASGALALLKSADELLREADDVALYPVREALAADIAALESTPVVDVEGLYLRLSAMSRQVPQLRLIPVSDRHQLPQLLEELTPEDIRDTWGSGAREAFGRAMGTFEKLVVIQHRDEPIEPLLSPEQTYYLQQNLLLTLEQTQQALLQRRQGAYSASLEKAEHWIQDYFEASDATTQSLLRAIGELKQENIAPDVPSVAASLEALKQHMDEMRRLKREGGRG